jgi:hypothetical protein
MSLRTRAIPEHVPDPVRRWVLRALFRATADAFEEPLPDLRGLSNERLLHGYASWSNRLAREVLDDPSRRDGAERRLFANTERLGRRARRMLGVRTTSEAMHVARRVYELIGIDLTGDERGRVVVAGCRFATTYSPDVCGVMSASDAGLLAGLAGGGRLTFTERISAGAPACIATLQQGAAR